ncbi:gag-pol polyprotein [Trifolium medium]|uniref:Gag-pol polyprotein n=1 Tax=Trifolium medium TaxID=97028 RepID=A0A392NAQ3_9FABA|nr:gag-pol polyprotein [Trifolium medium]
MDILGSFPTASGQNKYLIVAEFLAKIGTTQHFTSVEHPQTNGQAEAANSVILRGLKRRLGEVKKKWTEELHSVPQSYRTTPNSTTGETPFRLTYRTEAVIPVETGASSHRTEAPVDDELNGEMLREELDLLEELRDSATLREASLKQKIAIRHDKKVIKRDFDIGSLVPRRNQKDSREGKLAANWEGPYRVQAKIGNGAYYLENLYGEELPRPWNAEKLKQYYS